MRLKRSMLAISLAVKPRNNGLPGFHTLVNLFLRCSNGAEPTRVPSRRPEIMFRTNPALAFRVALNGHTTMLGTAIRARRLKT